MLTVAADAQGRVLVGGEFTDVGGEPRQSVARLLVAGTFENMLGQSRSGLACLLDPDVLGTGGARPPAALSAWPSPARGTLHLRLDAPARPGTVQLVDGLGRVVYTQPVSQAEMVIPTADVRPGVYLLRVNYATGPVTRRIVVE